MGNIKKRYTGIHATVVKMTDPYNESKPSNNPIDQKLVLTLYRIHRYSDIDDTCYCGLLALKVAFTTNNKNQQKSNLATTCVHLV
jgi:hypothetical protein